MDLDLVGYLYGLLDPEDQARAEAALRDDAASRAALDRLRANLAPLDILRRDEPPPVGLADRTLALIAMQRPTPSRRPVMAHVEPFFATSRWRRVDALIAVCVLIVVGGLGVSGVGRVRNYYDKVSCQNNLRQLHQAFAGYSLDHEGHFPKVSDRPPLNIAGAFVPILDQAGRLPAAGLPGCPVVGVPVVAPNTGGYAYPLGYRDPDGQLYGLRRDDGADADLLPILADRLAPNSHGDGHNVLYVGGNVRYCTTPNVGLNGDNIFFNDRGLIAAGLHRGDSVLGDGNTKP